MKRSKQRSTPKPNYRLRIDRRDIGWLCPECNTAYETLVKNFMERRPQC